MEGDCDSSRCRRWARHRAAGSRDLCFWCAGLQDQPATTATADRHPVTAAEMIKGKVTMKHLYAATLAVIALTSAANAQTFYGPQGQYQGQAQRNDITGGYTFYGPQ